MLRKIWRADDGGVSLARISEIVALGENIDEFLVLRAGDITDLKSGTSAPEVLAIELPQRNFGAGPIHRYLQHDDDRDGDKSGIPLKQRNASSKRLRR